MTVSALSPGILCALALTQHLDLANRDPKRAARSLWYVHALCLPLLFVSMVFATARANAVGGGTDALAAALPRASRRAVVF